MNILSIVIIITIYLFIYKILLEVPCSSSVISSSSSNGGGSNLVVAVAVID